ncbi:hypothetical protein ACFO3O_13355 [Dokdonia ponticola]|uniref:Cytochrome c domain-containing protein n=1 Tax=Dokdonia ponticola TaxID=2041041 RepID=A0ABV9HXK6_9FLAO
MNTRWKSKKTIKILLGCFLIGIVATTTTSCESNELSELLETETITDDGDTGDGDTDGGDTDGDTTNLVTYQNTAKAILDNACVQCHNATTANGGVRLHNYANASAVANSGRMVARMTNTGNPMPPSGNLPNGIIQDIIDWIDDGTLEN